MGRKKSSSEKLAQWILWGTIAVIAVLVFKEYTKVTDVTNLIGASKATVERTLDVTLDSDTKYVQRLYRYTEGEMTMDGGDQGVGLVYLDGKLCGMHIDHKKYSIFGIKMGDSEIDVDNNLTYAYEEQMIVLDDLYDEGNSRGVFYVNETKNDCLVITYNDMTGRVLAVTYYDNYAKVTETLGG